MYFITDTNGEELTFREAGRKVNKRTQLINNWYREHNCRTMQDIRDRIKLGRTAGSKRMFYETCRGAMTSNEIVAIILKETGTTITKVTVCQRMKKYPRDSVCQFFRKAINQQHWRTMMLEAGLGDLLPEIVTVKRKVIKFDSTKVCRRNGFEDVCEHYVSCLASRTERRKHHKRFKKDGTCYSEAP